MGASRPLLMRPPLAQCQGSNLRLRRSHPELLRYPLTNFYDRASVTYLAADRSDSTATCRDIHAKRQQ